MNLKFQTRPYGRFELRSIGQTIPLGGEVTISYGENKSNAELMRWEFVVAYWCKLAVFQCSQ